MSMTVVDLLYTRSEVKNALRRTGIARSVGSYGWDGGLGTTWANDPAEDLYGVLLTNQTWTSPTPPPVAQDFWTCTYTALAD